METGQCLDRKSLKESQFMRDQEIRRAEAKSHNSDIFLTLQIHRQRVIQLHNPSDSIQARSGFCSLDECLRYMEREWVPSSQIYCKQRWSQWICVITWVLIANAHCFLFSTSFNIIFPVYDCNVKCVWFKCKSQEGGDILKWEGRTTKN